jgi:mannitol/fructose-specific phosphotransferase system IIA component (Ntr-type)
MIDMRFVNLNLGSSSKKTVLAALVEAAAGAGPIRDSPALLRSLLDREGAPLFVFGGNEPEDPVIAVIHAGSELVSRPFGSLGISREGVSFALPSRDRIQIVLLLLFPMCEFAASVWGLARLMRRLNRREVRLAIWHATSPASVTRLLERAWQGEPAGDAKAPVAAPART